MVNFNGDLLASSPDGLHENRGFLYGDGVFETCKVVNNKVLFLEDHYFRLLASMRIIRMQIPMHFTMEYFESELLKTVQANGNMLSARVRCTVYRNAGGYYLPQTPSVSFLIHVTPLKSEQYILPSAPYEVDLFKDFYVSKQLLSTLKTTNKLVQITASIFADENELQSCLLLNTDKNVVEATHGNVFMRRGQTVITPPLSEGCLNGIMRKQLLRLLTKNTSYNVVEQPISPFELQKADELFISNVIQGIQPISCYRKKTYATELAELLLNLLNESLQFN